MIIQKLNFVQDQKSINFRERKQNPVSTAYHLRFPVSVRIYWRKKKIVPTVKRKNNQYKQTHRPPIFEISRQRLYHHFKKYIQENKDDYNKSTEEEYQKRNGNYMSSTVIEWNSTITKMKNSPDETFTALEMENKWASELEERPVEMIQMEEQSMKRFK